MDKHIMKLNASVIWHLLSDQKKWSYQELKSASKLSDRDLNASIGWLAKENKIEFEQDKQSGKEMFYLPFNVYI